MTAPRWAARTRLRQPSPVAIRRFDQAFYDLFTTHHRVVERVIEDGDRVYVWVRFTGTTADGTRVEAESNNHYVVRDGKDRVMAIFAAANALGDGFAS